MFPLNIKEQLKIFSSPNIFEMSGSVNILKCYLCISRNTFPCPASFPVWQVICTVHRRVCSFPRASQQRITNWVTLNNIDSLPVPEAKSLQIKNQGVGGAVLPLSEGSGREFVPWPSSRLPVVPAVLGIPSL